MIEAVEIPGHQIRLQRSNSTTFPTYLGTMTVAEALALSRQIHAVAQAATWRLWDEARGEVADLIDEQPPSGLRHDVAMLHQRVNTLTARLDEVERQKRRK